MKDAYYFPHDSNATDDPKVMLLVSQMQMEGYGIYWVIIEHLRNQPDFRSSLKILPALAMRNGSTAEKFQTVTTQFDLFTVEDEGIFYSESLINRMQTYLAKRAAGRKAGIASGAARRAKSERLLNEPSTSKVKESKVKETNTTQVPSKDATIESQLSLVDEMPSRVIVKLTPKQTFEIFWKRYHDVTGKLKTDKAPAFSKWKQVEMKLTDQRAAYIAIPIYFRWAMAEYRNDVQYVKKARTYLEDRAWENDYNTTKRRDPTKTYVK
jgi:hypothetical protein